METVNWKTSWKAQVSMGRWCEKWSEGDEGYEVAEQVQDSLKWKDIVEKAKNVSEL